MSRPLRAHERAAVILRIPTYRALALFLGVGYLVLFLVALRDLTPGGDGFGFLRVPWSRMFERTGAVTFEPVAQFTVPGWTLLVSPLNLLIGGVLAGLAALNLVVTWIAFRQPAACRFTRSAGIFASLPALLAGSACCAPVLVLLLGLQLSSLMMSVFQVLIPLSAALLLVTLKLVLDRTDVTLLAPGATPTTASWNSREPSAGDASSLK